MINFEINFFKIQFFFQLLSTMTPTKRKNPSQINHELYPFVMNIKIMTTTKQKQQRGKK